MRNIIGERPPTNLHGRLLESINFVLDSDIQDKVILDIGCGYGWSELNFLSRGAKKIFAAEVSEHDLKTIRENIKDARVETLVASATNIPLENASMDTVVSWEVIEHIPENTELRMFSEVSRVLKPGGVFYLSTPNKHPLAVGFDPAWWLIAHRHYTTDELKLYGHKTNLVPEKIYVKGRYWDLLGILNMYFSKWVLRRPAVYFDKIMEKVDKEYETEGFMGIFAKFRKR